MAREKTIDAKWGGTLKKIHSKQFFIQKTYTNESDTIICKGSEHDAYYTGSLEDGNKAVRALREKANRTQHDGLGYFFSFTGRPRQDKDGNCYIPVNILQNISKNTILNTIEEYSSKKKIPSDKLVSQIETKVSTTNTFSTPTHQNYPFFQNLKTNNLPVTTRQIPTTAIISPNVIATLQPTLNRIPKKRTFIEFFSDTSQAEEPSIKKQCLKKPDSTSLANSTVENNSNKFPTPNLPNNPKPF